MQVGAPNIVGRIWRVRRVNYRQGGGVFTTGTWAGVIECDGTVRCTFDPRGSAINTSTAKTVAAMFLPIMPVPP